MDKDRLTANIILVALSSYDDPVPAWKLRAIHNIPSEAFNRGLETLKIILHEHTPFVIEFLQDGMKLAVKPEYVPYLRKTSQGHSARPLSDQAKVTLLLIAHYQPISKSSLRKNHQYGIDYDSTVNTLITKGFVIALPQKDGHGYQYRTTKLFLDTFQLNSLSDLPEIQPILDSTKAKTSDLTKSL